MTATESSRLFCLFRFPTPRTLLCQAPSKGVSIEMWLIHEMNGCPQDRILSVSLAISSS
jgi:hypothetical protein